MNYFNLLRHELRIQARQKTEWASLFLFFAIVIMVMPFALGPEPDILRRLAPGLIWVAALLMGLLSLDRLFVQDARDGTLDQMLTSPMPLVVIIMAKLLAQMIAMLVALAVMIVPAALLLGMDMTVLPVLLATIIMGVPSLVLLGGIAGAMTIALQRNAALLTLLLIPFYIPILIFATSSCDMAGMGQDAAQPLLFLGAILVLLLPVAPLVIAASLRQGQS
jgi:heme exporter protein B